MKKIFTKYSIFFLIIGLGILIFFTAKVIMPLALDVAKSGLFLKESKEEASQMPVSTPLTGLAFKQCNDYIKSELDPETSVTFPDKPINAWSLGGYQYVINAEISVTGAEGTSSKKYACRITYDNGDDQEGVNDLDNCSIDGLSGLDDLL